MNKTIINNIKKNKKKRKIKINGFYTDTLMVRNVREYIMII